MEIFPASARDTAQLDKIADLLADDRHRSGIDVCGDATSTAERHQMAHQSVAGDIGGCTDQAKLGELCANRVDLGHERDGFLLERARSDSALDSRRGDT